MGVRIGNIWSCIQCCKLKKQGRKVDMHVGSFWGVYLVLDEVLSYEHRLLEDRRQVCLVRG